MRKLLTILTIALIGVVCLTSCGDSARAKKVVKTYLNEDAKTPLVEIYSIGELQDYPYDFKDTSELMFEMQTLSTEAIGHYNLATMYYDYNDSENAEKESKAGDSLKAKMEEVKKKIDEAPTTHYNFKKADVILKGKNAFGTDITQNEVFYFDENITVCSRKAEWLPKKIK